MPKNKKNKARSEEEDVDSLDAASIVTIASDGSDGASTAAYYDDFSVLHNVIERVNLASEALFEKRPEVRTKALNFIIDAFRMHNLCLGDSWNYEHTFFDGIEGVIKRGRPQERVLATECLSVFALQSDARCTTECLIKFLPILDAALRDPTSPRALRCALATTLAVLRFMSNDSSKELMPPKDLMKAFETIFRGSCLKGDGKVQILDTSLVLLHIAALRAWGLLYISLPTFDVDSVGKALLPCLISLLQAADVDMRITAGETVSVIYERLRTEIDGNYKGPYYTDLVRLLTELATDGTKCRSKVDRKKQRHSFRDLVDSVANYSNPETSIRFGMEVLELSSCAHHFCYDFLCSLLKGGLSKHLQLNSQVRALFDLSLPVVTSPTSVERKVLRDQRRVAMSVASKVRTQHLNTHRDRRSTVAHSE